MRLILDKHDGEILLASIKSDVRAFETIYQKCWPSLFQYAYNVLGDKTVCEDIIQDVFISLWQKSDTLNIDNLNAYLLQSVKYQIFKHLRNGKIADRHLERLVSLTDYNNVEENFSVKELNATIDTLINHLPERCRQIFLLSRFENLTNQEISLKLGLSEQTVKNQISKALAYLRKEIPADFSFALIFFQFV